MKTHSNESDRQQLKTVRISKYGTVLYYAGEIPLLNLSLCGAASASYVKVVILYMIYLKHCSICVDKVGAVVQYNKVQ